MNYLKIELHLIVDFIERRGLQDYCGCIVRIVLQTELRMYEKQSYAFDYAALYLEY